jgi:hypothetical protein
MTHDRQRAAVDDGHASAGLHDTEIFNVAATVLSVDYVAMRTSQD